MSTQFEAFKERYGPWALIAGATEGIGAAFSEEAARKGLNLVLVARRPELLSEQSTKLKATYGVETRTIPLDLASKEMLPMLTEKLGDLRIGLLIYNAAYSTIGSFFKFSPEEQQKIIDVNCRGPVTLVHYFGTKMIEKKKGGIILMSSLTAFQGSPLHTHYAATKAFNLVFAEGLWYELKEHGVDMLACCAGATATPNYIASNPRKLGMLAPKPLPPDQIAKEAFAAIGKKPAIIPGKAYRFSNFLMTRLFPRRQSIQIMGDTAIKMYGDKK